MRIINTAERDNLKLDKDIAHWVYNGLDCMLTTEIFQAIKENLDPDTEHTYNFERELQGPLLEMSGRGIKVDKRHRDKMVRSLRRDYEFLQELFDEICIAICDKPINAASPTQLKWLFYTHMKIPEQRVNVGGGRWEVSTNREALENIQIYYYARPVAIVLLKMRDIGKKIQTLTTGIDPDGRFRTSFNIASTVTGRLSSSENAYGTGGNIQNITGELRQCFVADKGKKLGYFDLQQAESRAVGVLAYLVTGHATYLNACEAGDLHTVVSKLCWPKLAWPGDLKGDRAVAEQPFYRMYSYRDLAKRGGHGSNYYGQPRTISRNLKIEVGVATEFQRLYFDAFPEISWWHDWVKEQLVKEGSLLTPFRRFRQFFGRPTDGSTIRAAIAHSPQSMIADMVDQSLIKIFYELYPHVELLLQVHDALVVQYPEEMEDELVPKIQACMRQEVNFDPFEVIDPRTRRKVQADGRKFVIGSDPQVGWNWAKYLSPEKAAKLKKPENLHGMMDYEGGDKRKAPQPITIQDILGQPLNRLGR